MEFIQGEKFRALADNKRIFYRDTHSVNGFLKYECPADPFILVSHNSDGEITGEPREHDADAYLIPDNLVHWYGQNVNIKPNFFLKNLKSRITALPIGLENSEWFPDQQKIHKMKEMLKTPKKIKNLLYVNHNISTCPSERAPIYQALHNKEFATVVYGQNGSGFDEYLENIYNHEFVVCPRGNGIDTHRFWETLYMGSIPVVKWNLNNSQFADLPVCYVTTSEDWSIVTREYLEQKLKFIRASDNDTDLLDFNYWKNKITNHLSL